MLRRLLLISLVAPLLVTACQGLKEATSSDVCLKFPTPTSALSVSALSVSSTSSTAFGPDLPDLSAFINSGVATPAIDIDWSAPHVPGQLLVSGGVSSANNTISTQALAAISPLTLSPINGTAIKVQTLSAGMALLTAPDNQDLREVAQQLVSSGLKVQPNFLYFPLSTPNDPGVPGELGIGIANNTMHQDYLTRIKAQEAWNFMLSCKYRAIGAKVGIMDTAIDTTHPDLQGRFTSSKSFITTQGGYTNYSHGTAGAGIIGALGNNSIGLAGITWSGPMVSLEVINSKGGSTTDLVMALNYAVQENVKVLNISLGVVGNPGDQVLDNALYSTAKTIVMVAAAGNNALGGVNYPASHPSVIAVGALGTKDDQLACYSARPTATIPRTLDIVAPGGANYPVCSDATSPSDDLLVLTPNTLYAVNTGTSFAAPMVTGAVALMRGINPQLSALQIRAMLLSSANHSYPYPLLDVNAAVRAAAEALK